MTLKWQYKSKTLVGTGFPHFDHYRELEYVETPTVQSDPRGRRIGSVGCLQKTMKKTTNWMRTKKFLDLRRQFPTPPEHKYKKMRKSSIEQKE